MSARTVTLLGGPANGTTVTVPAVARNVVTPDPQNGPHGTAVYYIHPFLLPSAGCVWIGLHHSIRHAEAAVWRHIVTIMGGDPA